MVMKLVVAVMALFIAGCGGGSTQTLTPTPTPTPTPSNLQAGQWEFVLTPAPGNPPLPPGQPPPFYVEANLTVAGSSVFSSDSNTLIFANKASVAGELPESSCNVALNATISGTTLSGTVNEAPSPLSTAPWTLTAATIAANGQSVSGGSYSASATDNLCGFISDGISGPSGTLSGYVVAPVNGTYSGTLNLTGASGSGVLGQLTLQVTQNGFNASASGTLLRSGVTTNLATGATTGTTNSTTGALVGLSGTATNINSTDLFTLLGHVTSDGSQMTVFYQDFVSTSCELNSSCVFATGTLNKQ
jgi:hypothetical protein